jgi:hypothetical protein
MTRSARKKALVFIDHDLIIRHFIKSGAFRELERAYDVTYVFNDDPDTDKKWIQTDLASLGLGRYAVTQVPRRRMGSWYKLFAVTVLHNQRGTPNYPGRKRLFVETVGWVRAQALTLLSLPGIYSLVRRRFIRKQGLFGPLLDFIEGEAPDILIQPSILTGYYINELVLLSKELGIPYVVLMNSWDNPSQKAGATGHPDKLVVWGEQTRRHAIEYMHMPPEDIRMFGAAQFQVYRRPVRESDAELRALFKVPDGKPIVLYAGVSKSINETRHLRLLEEAIERGAVPDCHILFRPHPWRGGLVEGEEDFFAVRFKHVSMDPFLEDYYRRVVAKPSTKFEMADYEITAKLLKLVSGTISSLSTILLETLLHGKPVVSFLPAEDRRRKYGRTALNVRLAHFAGLWGRPGFIDCFDDAGLPAALKRLLEQAADPGCRERIRAAASDFVVMDGPSYGERLVALADEMTGPVPPKSAAKAEKAA